MAINWRDYFCRKGKLGQPAANEKAGCLRTNQRGEFEGRKEILAEQINILFSALGIDMAVLAVRDANNGRLGKALMNAGAALAISMAPLIAIFRA